MSLQVWPLHIASADSALLEISATLSPSRASRTKFARFSRVTPFPSMPPLSKSAPLFPSEGLPHPSPGPEYQPPTAGPWNLFRDLHVSAGPLRPLQLGLVNGQVPFPSSESARLAENAPQYCSLDLSSDLEQHEEYHSLTNSQRPSPLDFSCPVRLLQPMNPVHFGCPQNCIYMQDLRIGHVFVTTFRQPPVCTNDRTCAAHSRVHLRLACRFSLPRVRRSHD